MIVGGRLRKQYSIKLKAKREKKIHAEVSYEFIAEVQEIIKNLAGEHKPPAYLSTTKHDVRFI